MGQGEVISSILSIRKTGAQRHSDFSKCHTAKEQQGLELRPALPTQPGLQHAACCPPITSPSALSTCQAAPCPQRFHPSHPS